MATKWEYGNFDVSITRDGDRFRATLTDPEGGDAEASFGWPFAEGMTPRLDGLSADPARGVVLVGDKFRQLSLKGVGSRLFSTLFAGKQGQQAGELLAANFRSVAAGRNGFRLRLRFNQGTQALAALPWETLCDREGHFIALGAQTPILRYLPQGRPSARSLSVKPPLRLLVVVSQPTDVRRLDVEEEWNKIEGALKKVDQPDKLIVERIKSPTLQALREHLTHTEIHLLHFIGHGGFDEESQTGSLAFEDAHGKADWVSGTELGVLLHNHPSFRLAFLNACEGAIISQTADFTGAAQALLQGGVPAVVAMQTAISDRRAIELAQAFYSTLVSHPLGSVEVALTQARTALYRDDSAEWAIPILFSRSDDNSLFEPRGELWTVPFPRNDNFVGREEDLADLHAALQGEETVGIRPAGLTGQGGIGKTQLAVEYCYRHFYDRDDYPGGVFWVNAAEEWRQGFAELGRRVEPDCAERPTEQQIQAAARYLHGHTDALLVLDNVEDPARLLRPVIPELIPANLPGPVLFTTRRRDLGRFQPVEVSVLPPEPALALLLSHPSRAEVRQPHHPEHATAQEICRILGGLPLALEIAAAHLGRRKDQAVAAYRDALLKRGALAVVDDRRGGVRDEDLGTRHAAAVAASLAEQWESLESEDARLLLRVAGQLAEAAQIPLARLRLLAGLSDVDDLFGSPLESAVEDLVSASLMERLTDDAIRLHPLVREFAAGLTPPDHRAEDRTAWAASLLTGYSRIRTLQDHCTHRGLFAVEQDLLAALSLLGPDAGSLWDDLDALYLILSRHGHELRDWERHGLPAYFAQQVRAHVSQGHLADLVACTDSFLDTLGDPTLNFAWTTLRSNSALLRVLKGQEDFQVRSVAVTANGQRAVLGSDDGIVSLWDLERGELVVALTGHEASVNTVAVTPDGRRGISGSDDRTVRLWDLENRVTLAILTGHRKRVRSVAVTPDGRRGISGSDDRTVRVWDLENGAELATMRGHLDLVNSVAVTPDGRRAVSGSDDRTVRVWNPVSGQEVVALTSQGFRPRVNAVALTMDGQRVVSGLSDGTVRVWDIPTRPDINVARGEGVAILHGHEASVTSVAVTPDGRRAVSGSEDQALQVWDLVSGKGVTALRGHDGKVVSVAVTVDGRMALSGSIDQSVRVWDIQTALSSKLPDARLVAPLQGHEDRVTSVAVTADGHRAVSSSEDWTVRVWDLERGEEVATLEGHDARVWAVAVTPDGRRAVSGSLRGEVLVWDMETREPVATLSVYEPVVSVVATDGGQVVLGTYHGTVKVASYEDEYDTGYYISEAGYYWTGTMEDHLASVLSVAVTADGRQAVSGSFDRTVRVWDLASGSLVATLRGHERGVYSVAVTPDGRRGISGSYDRTLRVWDLEQEEEVATLKGHADTVSAVALTSDGRIAVSGSSDRTVRVWNLETRRQTAMIPLNAVVTAIAMAPDGRTIVAGDSLGNVHCLTYRPGRAS